MSFKHVHDQIVLPNVMGNFDGSKHPRSSPFLLSLVGGYGAYGREFLGGTGGLTPPRPTILGCCLVTSKVGWMS